jgi:hypothetical protein
LTYLLHFLLPLIRGSFDRRAGAQPQKGGKGAYQQLPCRLFTLRLTYQFVFDAFFGAFCSFLLYRRLYAGCNG